MRLITWIGIPVVLLVLLVAFWNWDWFIPLIQSRASAALGRPVTLKHLHVSLGPVVTVAVDDLTIADPPGWRAGDPPLGRVGRLTVQVRAWDYIRGRGLIVPLIALDQPNLYVAETPDGQANFRFPSGGGGSSGGGPSPQIGNLRITDGDARFVIPQLKSNFDAKIATQGQGDDGKILVNANGTYAGQPITGRFVGGAVLSLRDRAHPWPVDLTVENGPTRVALSGTLQDPIAFKGANVHLRVVGPDLSLLEPLTGFPIPKTPPYQLAGQLDLQGFNHIAFRDFQGRLGSSDIGGSILEEPSGAVVDGKVKPVVTLDLRSTRVDLNDLAGFIGGVPGSAKGRDETAQQRAELAKANASKSLIPNTPISIPRLNWADIHLRYHADHIQGRNMPLDDLTTAMDVVNGRINVHPVRFGVGKGHLLSNIDLTPEGEKSVHARADIRMQSLDVSRLMAATHAFNGAGTVSGVGAIDATGNSLASLLGHGNGEVKMAMGGGNVSALMVDLTGLEFGKALLSALGIPQQTQVECFVGDLVLQRGLLDFKALQLDTKEALTEVTGGLNLENESIDLHLKTDSKHFSIGSLPTRINISGTFKDPSIRPGAEIAARAGAAAGLGVLFAPLAVLPTIQFGTSAEQDAQCGEMLRQARSGAGGAVLPAPAHATQGRD